MAQLLVAIAVSWLAAQLILKPVIASFKAGHLIPEAVFWQGGMPSGHAALVGALCSGIGKLQGFNSPLFAISVVFSVLVLYEALVTRNALMAQSEVLKAVSKKPVKAILGHKPFEVVVGLALGVVLTWILI